MTTISAQYIAVPVPMIYPDVERERAVRVSYFNSGRLSSIDYSTLTYAPKGETEEETNRIRTQNGMPPISISDVVYGFKAWADPIVYKAEDLAFRFVEFEEYEECYCDLNTEVDELACFVHSLGGAESVGDLPRDDLENFSAWLQRINRLAEQASNCYFSKTGRAVTDVSFPDKQQLLIDAGRCDKQRAKLESSAASVHTMPLCKAFSSLSDKLRKSYCVLPSHTDDTPWIDDDGKVTSHMYEVLTEMHALHSRVDSLIKTTDKLCHVLEYSAASIEVLEAEDAAFRDEIAGLISNSPVSEESAVSWAANDVDVFCGFCEHAEDTEAAIRKELADLCRLTCGVIRGIKSVEFIQLPDGLYGAAQPVSGRIVLSCSMPIRKAIRVLWHEVGHVVEHYFPPAREAAIALLVSRAPKYRYDVIAGQFVCIPAPRDGTSQYNTYSYGHTGAVLDINQGACVYGNDYRDYATEVMATGLAKYLSSSASILVNNRHNRILSGDDKSDGHCAFVLRVLHAIHFAHTNGMFSDTSRHEREEHEEDEEC